MTLMQKFIFLMAKTVVEKFKMKVEIENIKCMQF